MSATSVNPPVAETVTSWSAANHAYLQAELGRLRLLLRQRIFLLRKIWKRRPPQDFQGFQGMLITDVDADLLLDPDTAARGEDEGIQLIAEAVGKQEMRIEQTAQAVRSTGAAPALDILGRLFQLGRFERDVLLLCLAPEIDGGFERLYAYVQDEALRKYPTAALAQDLFGAEMPANEAAAMARAAFSAEASLRRFRLVQSELAVGSNWRSEPLRLDRRVGDYLLGFNHADEQLAAVVHGRDGLGPANSVQKEVAGRLERRLRGWDEGHLPIIHLTGAPGDGARAIALELGLRLNLRMYELDTSRLPGPGAERQVCYRLLERESLLLPCAYYLDCSEADYGNRAETAQLLELLQQLRALVVISSAEPLKLDRPLISVRVPSAAVDVQLETWKSELGEVQASNGAQNFLLKTVHQFHFNPQQIHRVIASAREVAALRDAENPAPTEDDLWLAARNQAARSMHGLAEKIEPRRSLADLVLPEERLNQLQEIVFQVEQRNRVYEEWGFSTKLSRGKGISALFAGPSGTGKTMAAEVLAGRLNLDLYRIDLAGVISKYIGETEKNLRRLFDAAEESGAILFFDEADSLFGKRSEVRDSHDRYANIEINYLLQRMEDYRGLAILATNRKSLLDPAFMRRIRFLVDFPFPAAAERARIWKSIFPAQADLEQLDYEFLGRLEIAGGNISNIALNAAFLAASQGVAIGMEHVLISARREYEKIEKLVLESEFGRYYKAVRQ